MTNRTERVLVLGATGKQGGATARALWRDGWRVRALVRDPAGARAAELAALGVELVRGDLRDPASLEQAASGAYGVFSVQPSSGQPEYGVTDADELRFGTAVIDAAKRAGVKHFIYTSVAGAGPHVGVGHFESKWQIERHLRASGLAFTVLYPAPFMEIFLQPYFGLAQGALTFFSAPEQPVQLIATDDIGVIAAQVFADAKRHVGTALELAGDMLSGNEIAAKIGRATDRTIPYARFPPEVAAQSPLFARILQLVEEGKLTGQANVGALRALHPGLLTFDDWLARGGAAAIAKVLPPRR